MKKTLLLASLLLLPVFAATPVALPAITVATAGTPVQASTNQPYWSTTICAARANTGYIIVKDPSGHVMVDSIGAGQCFTPPVGISQGNLNQLYVDASANSQVAYVTYTSN